MVKITFGDDTADDPAPVAPDFLLLLLAAATFSEVFFSSVSLSLSRVSLDSTLSTLELRVLLGTLELSFDKFDFFAGGFFELGGTFTGCWWLVLLPFTCKRFRWLGYFAVTVMTFFILNKFTLDFWGKRVGGDGDFLDFDRDPDKSLQ